MAAQRYKNPIARERMSKDQCPECGTEVEEHSGWGGPGCTLTDNGVAQRINQYRQDMDPANLTKDERVALLALGRNLPWGSGLTLHSPVANSLTDKALAERSLHYDLEITDDGRTVIAALKEMS